MRNQGKVNKLISHVKNIAKTLECKSTDININLENNLKARLEKNDFNEINYINSLKYNVIFYRVSIRNREGLLLKWLKEGEIPTKEERQKEFEALVKKSRAYVQEGIKSNGETFNQLDQKAFVSYKNLDKNNLRLKLEEDYKKFNIYNDVLSVLINDLSIDGVDYLSSMDTKEIAKVIRMELMKATNYIVSSMGKSNFAKNNIDKNNIDKKDIDKTNTDLNKINNVDDSNNNEEKVSKNTEENTSNHVFKPYDSDELSCNKANENDNLSTNSLSIEEREIDSINEKLSECHSERDIEINNEADDDCDINDEVSDYIADYVQREEIKPSKKKSPLKKIMFALGGLVGGIALFGLGFLYANGSINKNNDEVSDDNPPVQEEYNYEEDLYDGGNDENYVEEDLYVDTSSEFAQRADDPDLYLIEDSDYRYLSRAELEDYTLKQLAYIRNEIFARHGYIFEKEEYYDYFSSKSWYYPDYWFTGEESEFNDYELENIKLIKDVEKSKR